VERGSGEREVKRVKLKEGSGKREVVERGRWVDGDGLRERGRRRERERVKRER